MQIMTHAHQACLLLGAHVGGELGRRRRLKRQLTPATKLQGVSDRCLFASGVSSPVAVSDDELVAVSRAPRSLGRSKWLSAASSGHVVGILDRCSSEHLSVTAAAGQGDAGLSMKLTCSHCTQQWDLMYVLKLRGRRHSPRRGGFQGEHCYSVLCR